jgi:hypothetical protein
VFISLILFFWDKVFISLISTGVLLRLLGVVVAYYVSPPVSWRRTRIRQGLWMRDGRSWASLVTARTDETA